MPETARQERKRLKKSKNLFNRAIDIFVTMILGIVALYVWFIFGTNLQNSISALNPASLPSNPSQSPYCCKGSRGTGSWKYGLPYNLGDNPTIIPFIPCAIKMISFNWLRTLFYVKPWLAGTLKQSWSTGRGMVQGLKSYIPTPPPQKGGGRFGNAWNYVKGKGSNAASYIKGKGSNAASYIKGKGSNVASAFKGDSDWSFMELGYFILAPAIALITIVLSLPVSILLTYYGSFKTSLFWSIFGFLFVLILAAINSLVQVANLTGLLLFKGMQLATLKDVNKNFLKYGRGPVIMGLLFLILKTFPEIPFYLRIFLFLATPSLLFYFR